MFGRQRREGRMARNLMLAAILLSAAVLPSRMSADEDDEEERGGGGESLNGRKQQSAAAAASEASTAPYEYSPADNDWPHILKTGCARDSAPPLMISIERELMKHKS